MAVLFRAGCVLAVLCLVTAQTNEYLDSLIAQVFPETEENTTTKDPPSTGEAGVIDVTSSTTVIGESADGAGNCTCVPYYLCKTNTIKSQCENFFEVCCISGDNVESESVTGIIDIK